MRASLTKVLHKKLVFLKHFLEVAYKKKGAVLREQKALFHHIAKLLIICVLPKLVLCLKKNTCNVP